MIAQGIQNQQEKRNNKDPGVHHEMLRKMGISKLEGKLGPDHYEH